MRAIAIVIVMALARAAAAEPALDPDATEVRPGTVPIQLVTGAMIDRDAGTASFAAGTSRFVVEVRALDSQFAGQLDLVALIDASDRGIDIDHAQVDRVDGRVLVVPRAAPNSLRQLRVIELAYVPWNDTATLIVISSDAAGEELARWQRLAHRMIVATRAAPVVIIAQVGPYVMRVPRGWSLIRHATFDELRSRGDQCTLRSSDDTDDPPPPDAELRTRAWVTGEAEWLWQVGDRVFYEHTNADADVRIRCDSTDYQALRSAVRFVHSGRRAPRLPALVRIHGLLR